MRVKLDENEQKAVNDRIAAFENNICDDPGCWCHSVPNGTGMNEACERYHADLCIKFEFDPQGLTSKQTDVLVFTKIMDDTRCYRLPLPDRTAANGLWN